MLPDKGDDDVGSLAPLTEGFLLWEPGLLSLPSVGLEGAGSMSSQSVSAGVGAGGSAPPLVPSRTCV